MNSNVADYAAYLGEVPSTAFVFALVLCIIASTFGIKHFDFLISAFLRSDNFPAHKSSIRILVFEFVAKNRLLAQEFKTGQGGLA